MEAEGQKLKLQLVGATVFLMTFGSWGLTLLISEGGGSEVAVMAMCLVLGILLAFVTVPFLLASRGTGRGRLITGRVLVSLQALCHAAAMLVAVAVIVTNL